MKSSLLRINWSGFGCTKGRFVYCNARTEDSFHGVNYDGGFLVGWDKWSDGRHDLCFVGPNGGSAA